MGESITLYSMAWEFIKTNWFGLLCIATTLTIYAKHKYFKTLLK